ncbi:MAG: short-chain dehydrogenase [Deltaproteobacteria bacterium]|nr:short-chain dehydrogenase [Deltaproteobacteria bacterium]
MVDHIANKVIMITGAGGGFGRLVAEKTVARGAQVLAVDVDEAGLDALQESARGRSGRVMAVVTDVRDRAQMATAAKGGVDGFGRIDVLVNNAGVMPLAFFSDHADAAEAWERCIDINFKGVVNGIAAVHDSMIAEGRGHIVNLSSIYGNYPVAGAAVYGATKAAVNVLSESLRQESQGRIKVTTIRPTGVPSTGLGAGVINPAAIGGILGAQESVFLEKLGRILSGEEGGDASDPDSITYFSLSPEELADQIVYAIDQPWGVSISDLTVRASGDLYMI